MTAAPHARVDDANQPTADASDKQIPSVASTLDDLRFEAIVEFCDLIVSCGKSAAESAWRGERISLGTHLAQIRLTTIETIKVFKELGSAQGAE